MPVIEPVNLNCASRGIVREAIRTLIAERQDSDADVTKIYATNMFKNCRLNDRDSVFCEISIM